MSIFWNWGICITQDTLGLLTLCFSPDVTKRYCTKYDEQPRPTSQLIGKHSHVNRSASWLAVSLYFSGLIKHRAQVRQRPSALEGMVLSGSATLQYKSALGTELQYFKSIPVVWPCVQSFIICNCLRFLHMCWYNCFTNFPGKLSNWNWN